MTHSDIDEFQAFISFNFSKEHIFSIEKTVLNWQHKNTENYHYLIAKKVNLYPKDRWGGTPIDDAKRHGYNDIIELIKKGALHKKNKNYDN